MKNKIIYILLVIIMLFSACDEVLEYDYYIVNNCQDSIVIVFEDASWKYYEYIIPYNNNKMIYNTSDLVKQKSTFNTECVKNTFNSLTIYTVLDDTSKINFINDNLWVKQEISQDHLKCTLYVDSFSFK